MTAPFANRLLSSETVRDYVASRGLLDRAEPSSVVELGGGVSNVVLSVVSPSRALVVKQALPRLRVLDEWPAKRERALTEAAALRLAGSLTPGLVPAVVDVDAEACALTIAHAPPSWRPWKELLLAGTGDPAIAEGLGSALSAWHDGTSGSPRLRDQFDDREAFDQLRIDPYYRTVERRHREIAEAIARFVARMSSRRRCLVHGDFSPKNVLVGPNTVWIIDWEVAHYGDPSFDVAFMLNHLFLKALHRPRSRAQYEHCSLAFFGAWEAGVSNGLRDAAEYILGHVGCLMLARVDGKSPAEYLSESERERARRLGISFIVEPPQDVDAAWQRLSEAVVR